MMDYRHTDERLLERHARALVLARNIYKAVVGLWVLVSAGLLVIWWVTAPGGYFWPIWPILGVIIAAVIWGLVIYQKASFRVREEQVQREMERLRARQ